MESARKNMEAAKPTLATAGLFPDINNIIQDYLFHIPKPKNQIEQLEEEKENLT